MIIWKALRLLRNQLDGFLKAHSIVPGAGAELESAAKVEETGSNLGISQIAL